ncbi:MAG: AMP-binding protein, partial [Lachnospiraceae bacterium]|nr:AMP-binding protein [Lachnospiraceae bacterium]
GIVSKNFEVKLDDFLSAHKDIRISRTSFFLSAFTFLLCKYNATKSIISNMVHNGRSDDVKNTYGMFIKTMPFVFAYENDKSIIDKLVDDTSLIKELRNKNQVSFTDLAEKYGIKNDINFAYQDTVTNFGLMKDQGLLTERIYDKNHIEESKIVFEILKNDNNNYNVHLLYRSDYYSKEIMDSFVSAYIKVANEFLTKKSFGEIEITNDDEIKKLDGFFGPELKYDENDTIVSLINKSIKNYKNNLAVVAKNKQLTYDELRIESNKYSNFLIESGVKRGEVVAILIDRDEMTAVLPFASLKVGATYMPIDPAYPDDRVNFMLKDSGSVVLFTLKKYKSKISSEYTGSIVCIDDDNYKNKFNNDRDVDVKVDANDRFIILYTSGTTGTPKGVELLHKNIVATVTYMNNMRRTKEKFYGNVRVAAYASFGFDANMYDMYPPLTSGGTLFIIPDEIRLDLYAIREFYNKNKITHGFMTTQVARQFIELEGLDTLIEFGTGGEKLASVKPPKFKFLNLYGPTECTIFSTSFDVEKVMKDIPIGHATDNNHLYIIDEL